MSLGGHQRRQVHGRRKRGDGGSVPRFKIQGGTSPRKCWLLFASFLSRFAFKKLHWPTGKIKWPKFEEKTDFGGRLGFEPRTPSKYPLPPKIAIHPKLGVKIRGKNVKMAKASLACPVSAVTQKKT